MKRQKAVVTDSGGIHALSAARIVALMEPLDCDVFVRSGTRVANAKSIISLIGCAARYNQAVELLADGPDEDKALERLNAFLSSGNYRN